MTHEKKITTPLFDPLITITHGKGDYIFDINGNKYIDFTSGIAVHAFGHRQRLFIPSIIKQCRNIIHTSNYFVTSPHIALCKRLISLTKATFPAIPFQSIFLCNSGTEANEAALKFSRLVARRVYHNTKKTAFISCANSFHGRSMGSLSVTGQEKYRTDFYPLLSGCHIIPYNDVQSLLDTANEHTAAIIVEPMQGEGGLDILSPAFVKAIHDVAARYNITVIADEVQTGLCRATETFFASASMQLRPDIITLAKSIAGGLPMGATIVNETIHDILHPGDHGTTTGGGPVVCAAALAMLTHLQKSRTQALIRRSAHALAHELQDVASQCSAVHAIGSGHLVGLAFPATEHYNAFIPTILTRAQERGLLILRTGYAKLRLAPSLICPPKTIAKGMRILKQVLTELSV